MLSRRNFLSLAVRYGAAGATTPLWLKLSSQQLMAQSVQANSYRAMVLVYLVGGNDGNNTIVPMDAPSYSAYANVRGALAQSASSLIPIATGNSPMGFHSSLKNLAQSFNNGTASIVANAGPIKAPTTKQQIFDNPSLLPADLLSHSGARMLWEGASATQVSTTGWGGRLADIVQNNSGSLPPVIDLSAASLFTVGQQVQGVAVNSSVSGMSVVPAQFASIVSQLAQADATSANPLVQHASQLRQAALAEQTIINSALASAGSLQTVFPNTQIGNSLAVTAKMIKARGYLGASRQIFYCTHDGYDTHGAQLTVHASQLADLDAALTAFTQAMQELGLSDEVLLCTHSDFSRTLQTNSIGGTDHAWGNHQFILGGGLRGGKIFGSFPQPGLGGSNDLTGQGVWIPGLASVQMAAGIAKWYGLTPTQIATTFPDLANFSSGAISL